MHCLAEVNTEMLLSEYFILLTDKKKSCGGKFKGLGIRKKEKFPYCKFMSECFKS